MGRTANTPLNEQPFEFQKSPTETAPPGTIAEQSVTVRPATNDLILAVNGRTFGSWSAAVAVATGYPDAQIDSFGDDGIHPIAYEDTEHYRVTKAFLNNSRRMLSHLLSDD